ncbi:MAG: acyltransferase family protein, partial [Rhodothermales bacterium]|nr:acyltransferase family protein [Rhodothermales bacterium]
LDRDGPAGTFDEWIYAFHMPLFFFLSGLFAGSARKKSIPAFFGGRLRGIAYPYFVWILITGVIRTLVYSGPNETVQFLAGYWRVVFEPYDIYWFLYALFLISVVYYFLRRAGVSVLAIAVALLIVYAGFVLSGVEFSWKPANLFCYYAPYYAVGTLFTNRSWHASLSGLSTAVRAVLAGAALALVAYLALAGMLTAGKPDIFSATAGILAVIIISMGLERWGKADFIRRWGTLSLQIYVAHTIVGAGVRVVLLQSGISALAPHIVAGVVIALLAPILLYHVGNRVGFPYLFSLRRS